MCSRAQRTAYSNGYIQADSFDKMYDACGIAARHVYIYTVIITSISMLFSMSVIKMSLIHGYCGYERMKSIWNSVCERLNQLSQIEQKENKEKTKTQTQSQDGTFSFICCFSFLLLSHAYDKWITNEVLVKIYDLGHVLLI